MNPERSPIRSVSRDQTAYVQRILDRYRRTPGTTGRLNHNDRLLAERLYERSIPLYLVEMALALAALRRHARDPAAEPLAPIRSLHYFLPVLDELARDPPDEDFLRYLLDKMQHLT